MDLNNGFQALEDNGFIDSRDSLVKRGLSAIGGFMMDVLSKEAGSYVREKPEEAGRRLHSEGKGSKGEFTMYNPQKGQTDSTPTIMASGKKIYPGAIATSDYSMPLGTQVYIPQLDKVVTVEDRMNRRYSPEKYGKTVFDILNMDESEQGVSQAKDWGRQQLDYVVIGHDGRKETKAETPKKKSDTIK